ncbi:IS1634 family transposase [Methylohalobius crimeensis]|uniref:IS1634 family transposase n=1 Tax=Methylohalobius crimeensis TaxID=244365 RepID=UPI0003B3F174|nr:IS1634 family transposase [Methylohalobius crimeensis]
MYVRVSNSGGRKYLRLVESYRDENGRVRQRHIAQLGRLDELDEGQINGLIQSLRRFSGTEVPEAHEGISPQFERALEVGPTWLLTELWETLGLGPMLRQALRSGRRRFDGEAAVRLMVFNRLCDPESKLGLLRWLEQVVVPGIDGSRISHPHLLRTMDALMAKREAIHKALSRRLLPLLDREVSVVFYDLTTIRIQGGGKVADDLRRYGLSKELKGPARHVLGLVQTADGLPLDFELFEGNVAEVKTLLPMLERCLQQYPIERVIVVADRGLLSLDNVADLEQLTLADGRRLDYILAVPAGRYRDFAECIDGVAFAGESESVREDRLDGRRVVVAHDPERAQIQRERRRRKLDELVALGDRLAQKLDAQDAGQTERGRRASDRGAYSRFARAVHEAHFSRYIHTELDSDRFTFRVNEPALARSERLDGKRVLLTNAWDFQAEDIVARYKALADIERGFRVLKQDIEIAPVYHYKPDRIRAHALICFLALLMHRVMRRRLRQCHAPFSVERALEKLRAIQLHQVQIGYRTFRGLTQMTAEQLDLFKTMEVSQPKIDAL